MHTAVTLTGVAIVSVYVHCAEDCNEKSGAAGICGNVHFLSYILHV